MKIELLEPKDFAKGRLLNYRPEREVINNIQKALFGHKKKVGNTTREETLKSHFAEMLRKIIGCGYRVEPVGNVDLVIGRAEDGELDEPLVLIEFKSSSNVAEMIRCDDINRRALHELVLYYMQQRRSGVIGIQHLIIATEREAYVFRATTFERIFFSNTHFRRCYDDWEAGHLSGTKTSFFYDHVVRPYVEASKEAVDATRVDLTKPPREGDDEALARITRVLGVHALLGEELATDANSLDDAFYDELLHLLGLQESKVRGKPVIEPSQVKGTLREAACRRLARRPEFEDREVIGTYGTNKAVRAGAMALELALTWMNRLLFLKLLEAQLLRTHGNDKAYAFLRRDRVRSFDDLSSLYFDILAVPLNERIEGLPEESARIPYLNSSLFERTRLERMLGVEALTDRDVLPFAKRTVLVDERGARRKGETPLLPYLLDFLDAYDFGATPEGEVTESTQTLINPSVLGLIFEKINGHRDGAIFTPAFVTMHMSAVAIEKAVLDAFSKAWPGSNIASMSVLCNYLAIRSAPDQVLADNKVIDGLTVCDPAVGSGHFLVACLNEIIALKSRLNLLADEEGLRIATHSVTVDNDELVVVDRQTGRPFVYVVNDKNEADPSATRIQRILFREKRQAIERQLFGVDVNPISVRICRLRLWIELLKSAYYRPDGMLETLPNLETNVRVGNSLLSRTNRETSLSKAFERSKMKVGEYRNLVSQYRSVRTTEAKKRLEERISEIRTRLARAVDNTAIRRLEASIREVEYRIGQRDLLEDDGKAVRKKQRKDEKEVEILRSRLAKMRREEAYTGAFEWRYEFPEVLADDGTFKGFDIVIANPPYMRVQDISRTQPLQKEVYEASYATAAGAYDLANLFLERATQIGTATGGSIVYILPHKLFNSKHGAPLRRWLREGRSLVSVTHFGANQVFDGVTTYTAIIHLSNTANPDDRAEHFEFRRFRLDEPLIEGIEQKRFETLAYSTINEASAAHGSDAWFFFSDDAEADAFRSMHENAEPLGDVATIAVGLQTSLDPLYVVSAQPAGDGYLDITVNPNGQLSKSKIAVPTTTMKVESKLFRPFVLGREMRRFAPPQPASHVFFPYIVSGDDKTLVDSDTMQGFFPETWKYIKRYEKEFKAREGGKLANRGAFYDYVYPKNIVSFDRRKVLAMEIVTHHPKVCADRAGMAHTTKVYSVVPNVDDLDERLLQGLLGSNLMRWYLHVTGDTLRGEGRTFKTEYVAPFPIPNDRHGTSARAVIDQVASVEDAWKAGKEETILESEASLNNAVYLLYGLSSDQVASVEFAIGARDGLMRSVRKAAARLVEVEAEKNA